MVNLKFHSLYDSQFTMIDYSSCNTSSDVKFNLYLKYVVYDVVDELFLYIHPDTKDFTWVDSVCTIIESLKSNINDDEDTINHLRSIIHRGVGFGVSNSSDLNSFRIFPVITGNNKTIGIDWESQISITERVLDVGLFYAPYIPITVNVKIVMPSIIISKEIRNDPNYLNFLIYNTNTDRYWCNSDQVWQKILDEYTADEIIYSVYKDDSVRDGFTQELIDHWGFELCDGGVQSTEGIFIVEATSIKDNKYVLDFINGIPL